MENNFIVCLIGKSGSGKSTIAKALNEKYGWKILQSYTTRKQRNEDDNDHTFVDLMTFSELPNRVAYAEFDGNFYCATQEQVDDAEIYIIDVAGIKQLKKAYKGDKAIIAFYVDVSEEERFNRMLKRGDGFKSAQQRIEHDKKSFQGVYDEVDFVLNGNAKINDLCIIIYSLIDIMME